MLKSKYKADDIECVRSNMFKKESWLRVKSKAKDLKCANCGIPFEKVLDEKLGSLKLKKGIQKNGGNNILTICKTCSDHFVEQGVRDVYVDMLEEKNSRLNILNTVQNLSKYIYGRNNINRFDEMNIEELKKIQKELEITLKEKELIDSIDSSDWTIEPYLEEQYDVIMDIRYLKHEKQIEDYFMGDYMEYFECGQGFYQDEAEVIVKIANKFYLVTLHAEIYSSKQDVGDRLYWVEHLNKVEYIEIPKPIRKIAKEYEYNFKVELLDEEKESLDKILEKYGVKIN